MTVVLAQEPEARLQAATQNSSAKEQLHSLAMARDPIITTGGGTFVILQPAKLRLACIQRGWSFRRLSTEAQISRPTMRAALLGKAIRPLTAWRIAKALGRGAEASVEQLLETT